MAQSSPGFAPAPIAGRSCSRSSVPERSVALGRRMAVMREPQALVEPAASCSGATVQFPLSKRILSAVLRADQPSHTPKWSTGALRIECVELSRTVIYGY